MNKELEKCICGRLPKIAFMAERGDVDYGLYSCRECLVHFGRLFEMDCDESIGGKFIDYQDAIQSWNNGISNAKKCTDDMKIYIVQKLIKSRCDVDEYENILATNSKEKALEKLIDEYHYIEIWEDEQLIDAIRFGDEN